MADINTAKDQEFLEDGSPNPDYEKPKVEGEEEDTDPDKKDGEGEEPPTGDDDESVIPVRKSVAGHIIERKNKQIEKLKSKVEAEDDEEVEDDSVDLTPSARTLISKEIGEKIKPVLDTITSTVDESELKDLYASEPEAEKLDKKIRAYMEHPHYKGVPPAVIYHHLAFGDAEITGARKKRVADKEAAQNKGGGGSIRPKEGDTGNIPSVEEQKDMTDEEFEKLEHKVKIGKFLPK